MSKNSNKKAKWIIPFAVLSLTCASAGIMAGCNPTEEHTHSYEWKYNDTEHWKECPDDHEEEEGTRGEHVFVAGECECGKQEPVAEKKYGKVKGTVKLHKLGKYETDFTGVTVDMGDDVKPVLNTQTGELTVDKVEVGKKYSLTVSKEGYKPYSLTVNVPSEGQEVTVGGTRGIVLEYQAYSVIIYDEELHDFSNINDENPTIKVNGNGGKSLDIISRDTYGDVSLTIETKASNGGVVQGVLLKFEDGKYAMLNIKTDQDLIQYRPDFWGMNSIFGETQWVESEKGSVTAADKDKFNGDGVVLNLVRKGGKLIAFVDGRFVLETSLPEGYEDDKVQVGFFSFDVKQNAEWAIGVSETLPALETALDINVTNPEDGTECSVTAVPEKDKYALGEEVELTFTAPEHYQLSALTVNGVDKYTAVENGKLTVLADRATVEVNATFVKEQPVALSLTVKGKKLGTTANLAEGTEVRLSGISTPFTVGADGKITGNVMKGRYTVSVDGYFTKEVAVDDELTETVLEYDTFQQILGWGSFNFDDQNAESPKVGITNDCAVVLTKDTYGSGVMSSIYLKGENMNAGNGGIVFRFVGEGMAANGESVTIVMQNTKKVQVAEDKLWDKTTVADGVKWNNLIYFVEGEDDNAYRYADEHAEEYLEDYANGELKLSVLREESTFYVYLNGRYVGRHIIADKYKNARCEVGFMAGNLGNASDWKYWNVAIDENVQREAITVNDKTAANAGGTIEIAPETVRLGDTVTITVKPDSSHIFENLTVSDGITPVRQQDGTYTFVATKTGIDVTATFVDKPATGAEADVSGIGLGNAPVTFADGTVVTFTPAEGAPITLEVEDGRISGALLAGTYTATIEGYYGIEVTVGSDGAFEDLTGGLKFLKQVFVHNLYGDKVADAEIDYSHVCDENAYIAVGANGGYVYEFMPEAYGNVVFSTVFKKSSTTDSVQAIGFVFGDYWHNEKLGAAVRIEENSGNGTAKFQWQGDWGGCAPGINFAYTTGWQDFNDGFNPMSSELKAKYEGEGITVTIVRNGTTLDTYLDGVLAHSAANVNRLTADMKVYPFIATKDATANSKFYFSVDELETAGAKITVTPTTGISVTTDKTSYSAGEEATITVTREEGYVLDKIQVGAKCYDALEFNENAVATFKVKVAGDVAIKTTVSQVTMTKTSLASNVLGKKYGSTENLTIADGTAFKIFNNNFSYSGTIANGKISVASIVNGTYTVHVDDVNYHDNTITVGNTAYTADIALSYQIFTSAPASANLSEISSGKVTATGNGGVELTTKESYTDCTVEAVFDVPDYNGRRYSVALVFDDGKNFRVDLAVQDNGNNILQQTNWGSMMFNWEWVDFPANYFATGTNNYTEAEIRSEFIAKGLTYKLERTGSTVKLYINGVLMKNYELTGDYASKAAQLRFIQDSNGTDGTKGFTFNISVPEEA